MSVGKAGRPLLNRQAGPFRVSVCPLGFGVRVMYVVYGRWVLGKGEGYVCYVWKVGPR